MSELLREGIRVQFRVHQDTTIVAQAIQHTGDVQQGLVLDDLVSSGMPEYRAFEFACTLWVRPDRP